MEFKNEKIAGAAVVLAQMARSICERETMKAAREFLFWKMDNAPDCQANKLALIALFNDAIRTGRKAVFIAACNDIEQAAAAAAAEFWSAKRAQRVIKKCAPRAWRALPVSRWRGRRRRAPIAITAYPLRLASYYPQNALYRFTRWRSTPPARKRSPKQRWPSTRKRRTLSSVSIGIRDRIQSSNECPWQCGNTAGGVSPPTTNHGDQQRCNTLYIC